MRPLYLLLLLLLGLLPVGAQAFSVNVNSTVEMPFSTATAAATSTTAGISAAHMSYFIKEFSTELGTAGAIVPEYKPTQAANSIAMREQIEASRNQAEENADLFKKDALVVNLTPKTLWKYIKSIKSGDVGASMRDELQRRFRSIVDKIADTFTVETLANAVGTFVEDILSCNTPQLDALFPSIDLDLGFAFCDYGQMFNDMKNQVNELADKGWGGSFTINGENGLDVIKNPGKLSKAIRSLPPGEGSTIALDFFSDQSIQASMQGSLDTSALGQKLGAKIKAKDLNFFKDRTVMDALDDSLEVSGYVAQIQKTSADTQNKLMTLNNQIAAQAAKREEQARQESAAQRSSRVSQNIILNTQ